jgi:Zn-dependent peptidase ImmA (M78 family)
MPHVLKWARESSLLDVEEAAKLAHITNPEKLRQAEAGDAYISFRQLQSFAHACRLPLRIFYLADPPAEESAPVDFRSTKDRESPTTFDFIRTLRVARERRDVASTLYSDAGRAVTRFPAVGSDKELATIISRVVCTTMWPLEPRTAKYAKGSAKPLSITKEFVENAFPVLVFEVSKDLGTLRGCSLFDEPLSIIILSSKESPNTRRFTLAHELAHLFMRQSGICAPLSVSGTTEIERRCNRIAGEALLPAHVLVQSLRDKPAASTDQQVESLANKFQLSHSAVTVRLYEADMLSGEETNARLQRYHRIWRERQEKTDAKGGPHPYLSAVQHRGPTFTSLVLSAIDRDAISITRAGELLGVAPSYEKIEALREKMFEAYGR